jgi:hypothetical protein
MQQTLPRLWLALAFAALSAACSPDATNPTELPATDDPELKDAADKQPVTYAVIGDVPYALTAAEPPATTLLNFSRLIGGMNQDPTIPERSEGPEAVRQILRSSTGSGPSLRSG